MKKLQARLRKVIDEKTTRFCSVTTTQLQSGEWGYIIRTGIEEGPERHSETTAVGSQEDAAKALQAIIQAKLNDNYTYAKVQP